MSGPHSTRTIAAISSGSPRRPTGGSARRFSGRSGAPGSPRTVSMVPGTTQFTVMCCGARSSASARVRPAMPDLAVMTCARPTAPLCAVRPPRLTIAPAPARARCGRQACEQRNAPSRMVESTLRHSSKRMSPNAVSARTAALFTRKSIRPKRLTVASTISATAAGSVTSAICSLALPPSASIMATVFSASAREVRALTITAAPPAASERSMARPMLRAAPVTRATLPASSAPGAIPTLLGTSPPLKKGRRSALFTTCEPSGPRRGGRGLRRYRLGHGGRRDFGQHRLGGLRLADVVVGEAGAGGDEAPDDHVLLQPAQLVALAHDGRLGQHPGGLLEGGRRDERVGRQGRLGDAEEHVAVRRRLLARGARLLVLFEQLGALHLLALDEGRVARILDLDPAQHLAHDHLDVLVVDLHALQAIHVLRLGDDRARQLLYAEQAQEVVRVDRAVDDHLALVDHLAVVHQQVLVLGDQVLVLLLVEVGDHQALLALGVLAEAHRAGDFREYPGVLRRARLEQLRHPRQAAGDVARLGDFLRDARPHFDLHTCLSVV